MAREVRLALKKGREPVDLLFETLPRACGIRHAPDGSIDARTYVETLNAALLDIAGAAPSVRDAAIDATLDAFDTATIAATRTMVEVLYGPHSLAVGDQRMRTFIDRAASAEGGDERWLDGVAGHLCGRRLDAWDDQTVDVFAFEIRAIAQRLATLARHHAGGGLARRGHHGRPPHRRPTGASARSCTGRGPWAARRRSASRG